jgi:hypothetical protein
MAAQAHKPQRGRSRAGEGECLGVAGVRAPHFALNPTSTDFSNAGCADHALTLRDWHCLLPQAWALPRGLVRQYGSSFAMKHMMLATAAAEQYLVKDWPANVNDEVATDESNADKSESDESDADESDTDEADADAEQVSVPCPKKK